MLRTGSSALHSRHAGQFLYYWASGFTHRRAKARWSNSLAFPWKTKVNHADEKIEKDAVSGQRYHGHEWTAIKELKHTATPLVLYTFYACILFAVVWSALYPSIPGIHGYFHGILHYSQRQELDKEVRAAAAETCDIRQRIASSSLDQVAADPEMKRNTQSPAARQSSPTIVAVLPWRGR